MATKPRQLPHYVSGIRARIGGQPFLQICDQSGSSWAYVPYSDLNPQDHLDSYLDAEATAKALDQVEMKREARTKRWSECLI
jgi:hypothetical protein